MKLLEIKRTYTDPELGACLFHKCRGELGEYSVEGGDQAGFGVVAVMLLIFSTYDQTKLSSGFRTTSITNEYTSLKKYKSLTFYFRKGDVCCVWEMSGDKDGLLYWPKFFLDHSSTSSSSWLGCLTVGHWELCSPQSASWFSRWYPVYNSHEPLGHLVILFSNVHLLPLFFRLFTQVHLLIDGSVEGQYIYNNIVFYGFSIFMLSDLFQFFLYIYIYIYIYI